MSTSAHAYIAVFRGDPIDYQKYRHTSLWIQFPDQANITLHIVGPPQGFQVQTRTQWDPSTSRSFAKLVDVGLLKRSVSQAELAALAYATPPDNRNPELNCQQWIGILMEKMQDQGYLSEGQASAGLDKMLEATLEASDEPHA